ncbi:MAG: hypothetical protein KJ847_05825, partial [Firmicutes bacterium]|nr:hypothetical protein [Bacillota bacterium]
MNININNPWVVGVGLILFTALVGWLKRDLPDKKAPSLDWAEVYRKEHKLPKDSVCWPLIDEYESRGYKPAYYYPYRF